MEQLSTLFTCSENHQKLDSLPRNHRFAQKALSYLFFWISQIKNVWKLQNSFHFLLWLRFVFFYKRKEFIFPEEETLAISNIGYIKYPFSYGWLVLFLGNNTLFHGNKAYNRSASLHQIINYITFDHSVKFIENSFKYLPSFWLLAL